MESQPLNDELSQIGLTKEQGLQLVQEVKDYFNKNINIKNASIPPQPSNGSYTFVFISDSQIQNRMFPERTKAVEDLVNALSSLANYCWPENTSQKDRQIGDPLFMVICGDLTDWDNRDGVPDWEISALDKFRELLESGYSQSSLKWPVLMGLGNHDLDIEQLLPYPYYAQCIMWHYILTCHDVNTNSVPFGDPVQAVSNIDSPSTAQLVGLLAAGQLMYLWRNWSLNYTLSYSDAVFLQLHRYGGDTKFNRPDGLTWATNHLDSNKRTIVFQHYGYSTFDNNDWWADSEKKKLVDLLNPLGLTAFFTGHKHFPYPFTYNALGTPGFGPGAAFNRRFGVARLDGNILDVAFGGVDDDLQIKWDSDYCLSLSLIIKLWHPNAGNVIAKGDWEKICKLIAGGDGILYAVETSSGQLNFYKDTIQDGSTLLGPSIKNMGPDNVNWNGFSKIVSDSAGVIYAIKGADLYWFKDLNRDGTRNWHPNSGSKIGFGGWDKFVHIFAGVDGKIFVVAENGELILYPYLAQDGTSSNWGASRKYSKRTDWNIYTYVMGGETDHLYAVQKNGRLVRFDGSLQDGWDDAPVDISGQLVSTWVYDFSIRTPAESRLITTIGDHQIYAVILTTLPEKSTDLRWFKDTGVTSLWSPGSGAKIGQGGWGSSGFRFFAGGDGIIYSVAGPNMHFYKDTKQNGTEQIQLISDDISIPGMDWQEYRLLCCDSAGVIYAIKGADLYWFKDLNRDGTRNWHPNSGSKIGFGGWDAVTGICAAPDGILYVQLDNNLYWYKDSYQDGTSGGLERQQIGTNGWDFVQFVGGKDGNIYVKTAPEEAELRWYRDVAQDGKTNLEGPVLISGDSHLWNSASLASSGDGSLYTAYHFDLYWYGVSTP